MYPAKVKKKKIAGIHLVYVHPLMIDCHLVIAMRCADTAAGSIMDKLVVLTTKQL